MCPSATSSAGQQHGVKSIFWVFECPGINHIANPSWHCEVFSPCHLFQNITAFPCLTTSLIFSSHYFMGSFVSLKVKWEFSCLVPLCLSSVLVHFQEEFIPCQPGLCKDNPAHFYFPFSKFFLFTLVTFLGSCSCFHSPSQNVGHWHYTFLFRMRL